MGSAYANGLEFVSSPSYCIASMFRMPVWLEMNPSGPPLKSS